MTALMRRASPVSAAGTYTQELLLKATFQVLATRSRRCVPLRFKPWLVLMLVLRGKNHANVPQRVLFYEYSSRKKVSY